MDDLVTIDKCIEKPNGTIVSDMITVKILDVLPLTSYKNKHGNTNVMFTASACDSTGCIKLLVFDAAKTTSITAGETVHVHILDFIVGDRQIVVTNKTQIFRTPSTRLNIEDIIENGRKLLTTNESTNNETVKINQAATSPKKTTLNVTSIVYKVKPVQTKTIRATGEEVQFRHIKINDNSSKIDVILWRNAAQLDITKNQCVKLLNFSVSDTFNKNQESVPSLTNRLSTAAVELLPKDDLEPEYSSDKDNPPSGQIIGADIQSYRSCVQKSCYNRKLKENRCPNCGAFYRGNTSATGFLGKLLIRNEDKVKRYTVFAQQLQTLADSLEISMEEGNLENDLLEKLPVRIVFQCHGDKLIKLSVH